MAIEVVAPMPGTIAEILVDVGDSVNADDELIILEAMKMENALNAPCDGVVKAVPFKSGDTVAKGASLCVIG